MDTGQIRASDKVDMIVDRRRDETGKVQFGKLLYAALSSGHERVQLMKWGDQGAWFDPSGKGATVGLLQRPVSGAITSSFGYRLHPLLGYTRMHKGADFRAAHGTPILAAADGQVTGAGWAGGYGQQVRISHARGMMTSYSHMSAITALPGQTVRQSQVIGYVGSTGMSTGPHLHYELHLNGTPVDPSSVRIETRHELRGRELELFRQRQRHLLANSARERAVQS
jgi:murein DD-endopeptidase MepM/ murein hydrolase activator NlpD